MVILRGERAWYKDIAPPWLPRKIVKYCTKVGYHVLPELGGASTTRIALLPRRGGSVRVRVLYFRATQKKVALRDAEPPLIVAHQSTLP